MTERRTDEAVSEQLQMLTTELKKWQNLSKTDDYRFLCEIAKPIIEGLQKIIEDSPVSSRYINIPMDKVNVLKAEAIGELRVWKMLLTRPKELEYLVKLTQDTVKSGELKILKSRLPLAKYF